jgi:hypothetical protein
MFRLRSFVEEALIRGHQTKVISMNTGVFAMLLFFGSFFTAHAQHSISISPTVSGCYQNNGTKATISVEVTWMDAPASQRITVQVGDIQKVIVPGVIQVGFGFQTIHTYDATIVSPQVVSFELPADASTQTIEAYFGDSFVESTCKSTTSATLPAACPPAACASGQVGGMVFNDYNANGVKDSGETSGLIDVTVEAYDCFDALVGTATTDAFGLYSFTSLSATSYPIRLEFTNLPAYVKVGTLNSLDERTTTQFVESSDCHIDLGILDPTDYCQNKSEMVIPCCTDGDPIADATADNRNPVISFDNTTSGIATVAAMSYGKASDIR